MHKNIFIVFLLLGLSTVILNAMELCIPSYPALPSQQNYAHNIQAVGCDKVPLELQQKILLYVIINSNIHNTFRLTEVCKSWFCWIHGISLSFTSESYKNGSEFIKRAQELQNSDDHPSNFVERILQALGNQTAQEQSNFKWIKKNNHQEARQFLDTLLYTSSLNKLETALYMMAFNMSFALYNNSISKRQAALFITPFINPNDQDIYGSTALHTAVQYTHLTMISELLKNGADINKSNNDGAAPLHMASRDGHIAIVKSFLKNGAQINQQNKHGTTSLLTASCYGRLEVIKLLIEHNADINQHNNYGNTPLHAIAVYNNKEIVELLLAKGADVNKADNHGWTPLYAAHHWHNPTMMELLLKNGGHYGSQKAPTCNIS